MLEILEMTFRNSIISCIVPLVPQLAADLTYIDPGTGSLIIQIIIGSFIGGLFMLKVFWRKVSAFFSGLFLKSKKG